MSQRLVAKQNQYKKELEDFRNRIEAARLEGNNLLREWFDGTWRVLSLGLTSNFPEQQIFLEQRDFLKSKDIRLGRQFLILMANGAVFMTQFFAIRKMIEASFSWMLFVTRKIGSVRSGLFFFDVKWVLCSSAFWGPVVKLQVNYPGLATGGTAWFVDLTASDPYFALPLISAVTMGLVTRVSALRHD